jgi:hypothetical protein
MPGQCLYIGWDGTLNQHIPGQRAR